MQLINRIKSKYIYIAIFTLVFLFTRLPGLSYDVINPDATNWHLRAEQFVVGIKHSQLERTYQHYQPGITLMWIVGVTVEVVKQLSENYLSYNQDTFLTFHYVSKIVLVFVQLILSLISFYLFSKITNIKKAFLVVLLFSLEPFFVANSRVLHLDVLLTLLLLNGLLFAYLHLKKFRLWNGILAGIFLGFAVLTKSVAVGGVLFAAGVGWLYLYRRGDKKLALKYAASILVPALVVFIALFPALWVNAKEVLYLMFDGIERVGIRRGHGQIFFGEYTRDPGAMFYLLILFLKVSPFLLIGLILNIKGIKKPNFKEMSLNLWLGIFVIGYLIVMTYSSKKIDRYLLPTYPLISLLAVDFFYKFKDKIYVKVMAALMLLLFVVWPFFKLYPYNFTYTSPLFGTSAYVHENILAQKPFGVGVPLLKAEILEKYGYYPTLGFIDKKPMAAIYKGSRVFDIRVDGTRRYDLLVLGVNEEIPEDVLNSGYNFTKDYSIYINGLEYWKVYVKELKN